MVFACSKCGAQVTYAVTKAGTRILMDLAPHPRGNIRLEASSGPEQLAIIELGAQPPPARYRCHWASCSHYQRHQGKEP
jgi:hypothetical protein